MINVVVVNKHEQQGKLWSEQLERNGYCVAQTFTDIYAMIQFMTHRKVHIVICASTSLKKDDYPVLLSASLFFARVKVMLIGGIERAYMLSKLPNVILKQHFGDNPAQYYHIPEESHPDEGSPEERATSLREVSILLEPHFIPKEEAEILLSKWKPSWKPGYAIMSVMADSFHDEVYKITVQAARAMKNAAVFPRRPDEVQILFHSLLMDQRIFTQAYKLRKALLKETDAIFTIGIGRIRKAANALWASAEEARRAASSAAPSGQNSVVHIGYLDYDKHTFIFPHHKQRRLISSVMEGNCEEALRMLDEIFDSLKLLQEMPQDLINKIALSLFVDMNTAAASQARAFEKKQINPGSVGDLIKAESVQDTYDFLKAGIEKFSGEMAKFLDIQSAALFSRLERYMERYPDADLESVVRHCKATVHGLNTSVYNHTGRSIFHYVKISPHHE